MKNLSFSKKRNFLLLAIVMLMPLLGFAQLHVDTDEDVGIGSTNTNRAKLRVYNNNDNRLSLLIQNHNSAIGNSVNRTGIFNDYRRSSSYTGTGITRGVYNYIRPYGTGVAYGIHNYVREYGTGTKYGIYNYTRQNSGATTNNRYTYGMYNIVYPYGTSYYSYGLYNYMVGVGNSTKYGIYNYVRQTNSTSVTRSIYGIYQDVRNYAGGGGTYGNYTWLRNYGAGTGRVAYYGRVERPANLTNSASIYGVSLSVDNNSAGSAFGLSVNTRSDVNGTVRGIYNVIPGVGTGKKYGIHTSFTETTGSTQDAYGFYNYVSLGGSDNGGAGIYNYVLTNANSTGTKYGIYNRLFNQGTGTRYALYSRVDGAGDYAGYFYGNVYATGTILNGGSDERLKENVQALNGALSIIQKLTPKTYTFKKDLNIALPTGQQYGIMAQELEKVLPSLVSEVAHPGKEIKRKIKRKEMVPNPEFDGGGAAPEVDENGEIVGDRQTDKAPVPAEIEVEVEEEIVEVEGESKFKAVNYEGLIPVLIAAMQEQQQEFDKMKEELAKVKSELEQLKRNKK